MIAARNEQPLDMAADAEGRQVRTMRTAMANYIERLRAGSVKVDPAKLDQARYQLDAGFASLLAAIE